MAKILFVMTSSDHWTLADGTKHPTGFWAEEAVIPFEAFTEAGQQVTIATPSGEPSPVDEASLTSDSAGGPEQAARMRRLIETAQAFREPQKLSEVELSGYDGVYLPGGHGPMEDLAVDATVGALLIDALERRMPVGIVCHGSAALLSATDEHGTNAYAGYRVTAFSDEEEQQLGSADQAKWLLEDRLGEAGLGVTTGRPLAAHVQVDRQLVTGQNPASSRATADALLGKVREAAFVGRAAS